MATDDTNPVSNSPTSRVVRSPGIKFLIIIALTVAMAVPLFLVQMTLSDREQTAQGAANDIALGWGGSQVVAGPILELPYTVVRKQIIDGKEVEATQRLTAILLPDVLNADVHAAAETRWRGIFEVPVYRSKVILHATFNKAAMAAAVPQDAHVLWNQAAMAVLVSDARGLADNVMLTVNGHDIAFEPGAGLYGGSASFSGMNAPLGLGEATDLTVDTNFLLRGSREFSVSPLGRRTVANIHSNWSSPSFFGAFLPAERKIDKDGFYASWTVPYLARGFGQSFATSDSAADTLFAPAFGARFYQPVDHYQLVERSLKYAILFVALAFLVFFVVETVSPRRLHFIQYTLVGIAQVLFYLLLLSFRNISVSRSRIWWRRRQPSP